MFLFGGFSFLFGFFRSIFVFFDVLFPGGVKTKKSKMLFCFSPFSCVYFCVFLVSFAVLTGFLGWDVFISCFFVHF